MDEISERVELTGSLSVKKSKNFSQKNIEKDLVKVSV